MATDKDQGKIVQVNISLGGLPKRAIGEGVVEALGIVGDRHAHPNIHGGPGKAILMVSAEIVDELVGRGYPLFYGALGENLTVRGIEFRDLRIGDEVQVGGARIEITQPRGPCKALDVYGLDLKNVVYDAQVKARDPRSPRWGMSGMYARVIEGGPVRAGDPVTVLCKLA